MWNSQSVGCSCWFPYYPIDAIAWVSGSKLSVTSCSASSSHSKTSDCMSAFDGSLVTAWVTLNSGDVESRASWIQAEFGQSVIISRIEYQLWSNGSDTPPVLCTGMPTGSYCNCGGDCGGSFCQCAAAFLCCGMDVPPSAAPSGFKAPFYPNPAAPVQVMYTTHTIFCYTWPCAL